MYWINQAEAILEDLIKEHGKRIEDNYDAIREELLYELQPLYIEMEGKNFTKTRRKKVMTLVAAVVGKYHPLIRDEVVKSSHNSAVIGASSIHYQNEMKHEIKIPLAAKVLSTHHEKYNKNKIHEVYIARKLNDKKNYADRIRKHHRSFILETTSKVGRGVTEEEGWIKLEDDISKVVEKTKKKVKVIQEVEGERIKEEARADAVKEEAKVGVINTKTWHTVLDASVRDTHMELHGETIPEDGYFKTANGEALHPRGFGIPSEDINCRCTLSYGTAEINDLSELGRGFEGITSYDEWIEREGYILRR